MLVVKLPLPLLALGAVGTLSAVVRRTVRSREFLFVLLPMALVVATNVAANLGLGVRRLAPAIPFLMIAAGWPLRGRGFRHGLLAMAAVGALVLAQAVGVLRAHPHYLPYFHVLAGGPRGGERLLGDSNLDWGQDLSLAAAWLRDHDVDGAVLSYFGTADAFAEGIAWQLLPPTARPRDADPWTTLAPEGPQWLAMSVTNLQGVYSRLEGRDVPYPWLTNVEPDVVIGGSIHLYEIGDAPEIQRGLANAYARYGMRTESENALVRSGTPTADDLAGFAQRRRTDGDETGAAQLYVVGVRRFPNDAGLHNDAAWMMQESGGDLHLALEYADRAVALDPNDPGLRDTRGMVHHRRGDAAKALADFDAALRAPGGDVAEIRWHRARALADAGSSGEAEAEARRLLDRADLDERVRSEITTWLATR
jgi:tetratricopeptide (TPR) repeat protein